MSRRNSQEPCNAKFKKDRCDFVQVGWDAGGNIDRERDSHGHIAAGNGNPENGATDRPAVHKMPHSATCVKWLRTKI